VQLFWQQQILKGAIAIQQSVKFAELDRSAVATARILAAVGRMDQDQADAAAPGAARRATNASVTTAASSAHS